MVVEKVAKNLVGDVLVCVKLARSDDDLGSYFDITVSIADGIFVNHKVCLSLDDLFIRSSEAEEGQESNQKSLSDQKLDKETTFSLEVFFDEDINIAQIVSDHLVLKELKRLRVFSGKV